MELSGPCYAPAVSWSGAVVAICRLEAGGDEGAFVTGRNWRHDPVDRRVLELTQATELERIWEELPDLESMRCHIPRHGIEVSRDGLLVLRAAICFECNNASIATPQGYDMRAFDGASAEAVGLHRLLESLL